MNLPNIKWSPTSVSGLCDKLVETLEICGCVQQAQKPTRENYIRDLLFTVNTDHISVHVSNEFIMWDYRVLSSIIYYLNTIQINSKAAKINHSWQFDQQTWKRTETLI